LDSSSSRTEQQAELAGVCAGDLGGVKPIAASAEKALAVISAWYYRRTDECREAGRRADRTAHQIQVVTTL
jgi:hypothetical protein